MPVTLSTPAHVRAHLRSLYNLLEALQKALMSLIQSFTTGISLWLEQHRVMLLVLERYCVENFQYPRELPQLMIESVHPALLSNIRSTYFKPAELRQLLIHELTNPLTKIMEKIQGWTAEFEFCFSRRNRNAESRGKVEFLSSVTSQPEAESGTLKDRRKQILSHIQKLDVQLSGWLRHHIPKVFGTFSVLFAFAAQQFDGKVMERRPSFVLPHILAAPHDTFSPRNAERRARSKSVVDAISQSRSHLRSYVSRDVVKSLPEVFGTVPGSNEVIESSVSSLSPSGTFHSPNSAMVSMSGGNIPSPPNLLPTVVPSRPFNASQTSVRSESFGASGRVLSSREWGGENYSKAALLKQLEEQVDIGRVAFDNIISLAFAFSRALEKLMDAVLHEDEKFRSFLKLVRQSLFSLEEFVYRDYSELQSMLPLNFVKIIRQLDEPGKGHKKTGFKRLFSSDKNLSLSPRVTAFPVRPVHVGLEESERSSAWLDRPLREQRDTSATELVPNPLKGTEFDIDTMEKQKDQLLSAETSRFTCESSSQGEPTTPTVMSPAEKQKLRVCDTVEAYNALVCGYFHKLSKVYETL